MSKKYTLGNAYTVHTSVDEFRHDGEFIGVFSVEKAAEEAALGHGWYGSKGNVRKIDTITIDGEAFWLKNIEPLNVSDSYEKKQMLISQAKSKLSLEEQEALGLL